MCVTVKNIFLISFLEYINFRIVKTAKREISLNGLVINYGEGGGVTIRWQVKFYPYKKGWTGKRVCVYVGGGGEVQQVLG